ALNEKISALLKAESISLSGGGVVPGAKPNSPREDVYRLESYILHYQPDFILTVGGGSAIDSVKAANVLACLGKEITPEIDNYFGTGVVSEGLKKSGKRLRPLAVLQTSASSGSHLTKYSNVTDMQAGQKKIIVDEAVVPAMPFFDYALTATMPLGLTIDGALDTISHTFEVFCGAGGDTYDKTARIAETAIDLVVANVKTLLKDPQNLEAREAIGLASDLGAYAIMIGGTSGAHLTSFSLVDIVAHGTACGLMNPYYAVFYSRAIQKQLKVVGGVFRKHGYISRDLETLGGRDLALAVAEGMISFAASIGAPVKLGDIKGFSENHVQRALNAAKDPQLEMKLRNMPVPLTAADVDKYMEPILRAAASGDMSLIKEFN
ncbi:MAG: iron-containing alcohol dehydrogenase, partial [Spirochaetaceae bacterium]|nr:iron-containing alcohol dehydrogenase [Spirochaetaceae bacterium]